MYAFLHLNCLRYHILSNELSAEITISALSFKIATLT